MTSCKSHTYFSAMISPSSFTLSSWELIQEAGFGGVVHYGLLELKGHGFITLACYIHVMGLCPEC